ncbi:MAG: glycosyltransferase [Patescibacteria group bacterium]
MKILQVNKFYYPKDGVSNYLLGLEAKLKEFGHEVKVFAMDSPKNIPCETHKYFVSYISFDAPGLINKWRAFTRIFYSFEAKRKFTALVRDFKPDIIHIHNIYHQISPSILSVAIRYKIPVVMHLHDYKLICPNYKLFTRGAVCLRCKGGKYYNCFKNKCVKNSNLMSLAASWEMYFHHRIWRIYERAIKLFIAPSEFMKKTCIEFSWPAEKFICLHNFFNDLKYPVPILSREQLGNYLLYFGRLSEEKGVEVLLSALTQTNEHLKIAGEGPEENALKTKVEKLGLKDRVEFLGFKTGLELDNLINQAKTVVIPSIWYENMPLNMLEALARGKIVLASDIGGLPEIIRDGENGFLFTARSANHLAEKINGLKNIDYFSLSQAARETVKNLDADTHTKAIIEIYQRALQ